MKSLNIILGLAIAALVSSSADARPTRGGSSRGGGSSRSRCVKRTLDRNKDGKVGPKELVDGRHELREKRAEVDKKWEEKADKNDNGKVDPQEHWAARRHNYLNNRNDVDKKWEGKADSDGNGEVDRKELHNFRHDILDRNDDGQITKRERATTRLLHKSKVSNSWEKKHDADGDGWISKEEAKDMLKDRLRLINTNGRAKVNCPVEKQFDTNNDGVIDRNEAKALIDFLKEKKGEKGTKPVIQE